MEAWREPRGCCYVQGAVSQRSPNLAVLKAEGGVVRLSAECEKCESEWEQTNGLIYMLAREVGIPCRPDSSREYQKILEVVIIVGLIPDFLNQILG